MHIILTNYQEEIVSKIIASYKENKDSILIELPAGTGKTVIAIFAVQRLVETEDIKNVAFISVNQNQKSNFGKIVSKYNLNYISKSYTYGDILDLIDVGKIHKNSFDLLIFDEAELESKSVELAYKFFEGFKIGLSRFGFVSNSFSSKIQYKLEQILKSENIITYQKNISRSSLDVIESAINKIEVETNFTYEKKQNLINKIEFIREEVNTEYEEIKELLKNGKISSSDIVEISYRKEQLVEFEKLLTDNVYFENQISKNKGIESVWQTFFEKNPWIFGFGLNYVFNAPLEGKKLEQTVSGSSITGSGKRTDALLATSGIIQSLCFVEIKTHKKEILKITDTAYRPDSWAISSELAGGIAQVQRTVQKSLRNIQHALELKDKDGFVTKEKLYLYKPKSFLLIGCLAEFKNENGNIHEEKYSSFEIFRRSISDVEIITFDELFERANAIVNKKWKF